MGLPIHSGKMEHVVFTKVVYSLRSSRQIFAFISQEGWAGAEGLIPLGAECGKTWAGAFGNRGADVLHFYPESHRALFDALLDA